MSSAVDEGLGAMEELVPFPAGSRERDICVELLQGMRADEEEAARVAGLEQGTEQWLSARRYRLTGSNFGAAAGRNPYSTPAQLAQEMLFPTFKGNDATRWGNAHEDIARDHYIAERREELAAERGVGPEEVVLDVGSSGLHIWEKLPFLASSPDGHVTEFEDTGLLEIKCPYYKKSYPEIPEYYMDQMQGTMAILGYKWADFVVWTEGEKSIRRVPFDQGYWDNSLLPALKSFYRDVFLPAYVAAVSTPPPPPPPPSDAPVNGDSAAELPLQPDAFPDTLPGALGADASSGEAPPPPPNRIRPVVSVVSLSPLPPAPPAPAPNFRPGTDAGPPQPSQPQTLALLPLVKRLDAVLRARGLRPEFVGGGADSLFLAVARQMNEMGRLDPDVFHLGEQVVDGVPGQLPRDALTIKRMVLQHVAVDLEHYAKASGMTKRQLSDRLFGVGGGSVSPGSTELLGFANLFGIRAVCFVVSGAGVNERSFGKAKGEQEVVLCTTGTFFWSTCARPEGPTLPAGEDEGEGMSKFSVEFQDCVCAQAEELRAGGMGPLDSLKGAFDVCNERVGERKYAEEELPMTEGYMELLEEHRAAIERELERRRGEGEAPPGAG